MQDTLGSDGCEKNGIGEYTHHWEHLHKAQQVNEHHTRRGDAELHLEERDGALPIAPDGHQDEEGGSALEEAAGAAGDHEDGTLRSKRWSGLQVDFGQSPKTISNSN